MGPDDDVDVSGGQILGHLAGLSIGQKPAQHLDSHRVAGEALGERLVMLLCQEGGRHEDRGLLAVLDRFEDSSQRHLGLAETDVAAHQPVHRKAALHVGLHLVDRLDLIRGLLERERLLEFALPRRVRSEAVTGGAHPLLVQHDEFLRDLLGRRLDPALGLLPIGTTHLRQGRRVATGVLADRVDLIRRQVQPVGPPVLEHEVVAVDSADGTGHHAAVASDAVLTVHDVVADVEVVEVG